MWGSLRTLAKRSRVEREEKVIRTELASSPLIGTNLLSCSGAGSSAIL